MGDTLNFQQIILRLLAYWEDQGCLVLQPYNVQVGAGTMNPATVLRVLGPEPWNVVYVEPSIRPDDGRFGDNPNRMQMHHQLQVILKPDPGNPQELYLKSLEAIGINPREHDIRFVEDNWESPALGAWGLGWEVWLNGQEITQFTYFQQAGGQTLDPVSVEITYGLDRIALALNRAASVWELEYGATVTYKNILLQSEIEHCSYYFNVADVDTIKQVYDAYESEAKRCVEAGLVLPAHDFNLKCSHLFNVLDTRGAVGVTERANYFHRMRRMARQVSKLYIAQREQLGYPLKDAWEPIATPVISPSIQFAQTQTPQTFLLEIGSEELPVGDLESALRQLKTKVPELLERLRLTYTQIDIEGTPRRLAVIVHRLVGHQQAIEQVVKGPPVDRAFDADGIPTQAALGFARSKGIDVSDLQIMNEGDKRYVTAVIHEEGRATAAILSEALPDLLSRIRFGHSMRWNPSNVTYSRPLRWFVALYGPDVIPFSYAGIVSGRTSRGLRPYDSPNIRISDGRNYAGIMRNNGIVLRAEKRRELILAVSSKLAAEKKGTLPDDPALLNEVANLVERPTPMRGTFDERYLKLPSDVLVAVMRKHQRYFPVYDEDGQLMAYFIAVRNGNEKHLDVVVHGNEEVLKARFADAEFFYGNDVKTKLVDFLPKLDTLTFQAKLGSMLDKVHRLEQLTPTVGTMLNLSAADMATAARAAALSKADLATSMVVEMTSLQGVMGGHYAQLSGEPEPVANAIRNHYYAVSQSKAGMALAIADRLDSLMGLFAAELTPKGSNDPFALRRMALQLIENLSVNGVDFDLRAGLNAAAKHLPIPCDEAVIGKVLAFINGRLEGVLREKGYSIPVIKAICAAQGHNPYLAIQSADVLSEATRQPDWMKMLEAYARCVRITRSQTEQFTLQPTAFSLAAEQYLYTAYETAVSTTDGTLATFLTALREMVPTITHFFDNVLVMDENTAVRNNRLALLQHIANMTQNLADFSKLEGF
ncbi:MAG: glycine--tRNA ligase subunit beta [Chloroflexi bacterium]|nr:glycine--tRNA ligase subunit beta [Chloroflexota bacterium]